MVESHTLRLFSNASKFTDALIGFLSSNLAEKGYAAISPSLLSFLGELDCGVNYAAEIARKLGVSRQMVAKHVKELCSYGYLEQVAGTGKQKQILFTEKGELLMSDARKLLAELDQLLLNRLGETELEGMMHLLVDLTNGLRTLNK